MKATKTLGPVLAALAAITSFLPAMADTSITTITTTSKPVVILQGSAMTAPTIQVTGFSGKSVTTASRFPIVLAKFTASNGITIFYPAAREDLSMRRDDLFARILIEQADGQLSSSASGDFINRLASIDAEKAKTPTDTESRAYYKHVKDTYADYDELAQDIQTSSHQGNKQLAGSYNYKVF
ncbi:hypothetical protein BH11CYA1_BH11CYA1_24560 [soil metagenome]